MIYVLEEGGFYKACPLRTDDPLGEYDEIVESGVIRWQGDRRPEEGPYEYKPVFVVLARVEANHDFIPTPEMRGEAPTIACPRCGAEFADDGPITYSGCLECAPGEARAAGARPAARTPEDAERCPPGCPKCADEYLAAKEAREAVGGEGA